MKTTDLTLSLARRLTDSRVPLPVRANLARLLRGSTAHRDLSRLTYALALIPTRYVHALAKHQP